MASRTHQLFVGLASLALWGLASQTANAIGGQFGLEFAIDAPWRLEPVAAPGGGGYTYGPIPILVTFDDAVFEIERSSSAADVFPPIVVGKLREIRVIEWTQDQPHPRHPVTVIGPADLREIERKRLVSTKLAEPDHEVCHPALEQSCAAVLDISQSHEWHAMLWYTPKAPVTPGRNIHLEVIVVTEVSAILTREWRNFLVVHAGEQPLPRFADDWLYGDLHYHSQMTDNEGESGYSYRNVARALGAMGIDFVFATDHASNGSQIDGQINPRRCAGHSSDGVCFEARDLNAARFAAAKSILYGPDGVNETIVRDASSSGLARLRAANVLPQIYMGEEVDAWPEISAQEQATGLLAYGDELKYAWPENNKCVEKSGLAACRRTYSTPYAARDHRSFLVFDEQGIPVEETVESEISNELLRGIVKSVTPDLTTPQPSRQHLVYLPNSTKANGDGWIGSDTGPFGGAGKRLQDVVHEVEAGGVAFLAHPLIGRKPGGPGPDVVPYSDTALMRAWRSPAILGLQFWNENDSHYSAPDVRNPTVLFRGSLEDAPRVEQFSFNWPFQGHNFGNFPWTWQHARGTETLTELQQGAVTWDRYLRKGLDPQQTAELSWLPPGEPRKWFMAGGSDGHGDLNYRRYGQPCIDRWCDVPVGDTAIANPRNLVSMSTPPAGRPEVAVGDGGGPARGPKRYTNVIAALQAGKFSVTDGPAIRIAVDKNRNGLIDAADFAMGSTFQFFPGEHIPLLVEWLSTPEFGPIAEIYVYVGNKSFTFAPAEAIGRSNAYTADPSGQLRVTLADAYGRFNRQDLPVQARYRGIVNFYIGPAQFDLAQSDQALSYVRAIALTITSVQAGDLRECAPVGTAGSKCGNRRAYSNPIWARYGMTCPDPGRPRPSETAIGEPTLFIDANGDGAPDTCAADLPDPCAASSARGRGAAEVGRQAEEVERDPERTPEGPRPAKAVPAHSCQKVAGL